MQVAKWGNSLAVRIPAETARALGLAEGDELDIAIVGDRSMSLTRRMTAAEAMARIRSLRTELPADYKFDREEANSRSDNDR
jgi:antitoxin MazE